MSGPGDAWGRFVRLAKGSGRRSPADRVRVAADLFTRLGPSGFAGVLRDAVLGPPWPERGGPHPPADGPPPRIPSEGPLISVLVPAGIGVEERWRAQLSRQSYGRWELCAGQGQGRAVALEDARRRAGGEWVWPVHEDDALAEHALAWVAWAAGEDPDPDVIYADEDVLAEGVRRAPRFKPDWSPELLLSEPYLGRAAVYRRSLLEDGFTDEGDVDPDYDLALRATERARRVHHVPRILLHTAAEPAPAGPAGLRALRAALTRRGESAQVTLNTAGYRVRRELSERPRVALVIPTRDRRDLLERCLESHWRLTRYPRCEVLVVDDGSAAPTRAWLAGLEAAGRIRVLRRDAPFNYSALMNAGAEASDADVLVLLNNDTEVKEPGWVEALLEHALRPEVGAVGARLLYPDRRVQHAGVVLGVGPHRVAGQGHQGEPAGSAGYLGRVLQARECAAVSAACLMIRRRVFLEVGGLDAEHLPISFNDVDLCLRLGQQGLKTVYAPWACLSHHGSASRSRATDPAEVAVMRERWGELLDADPYYSPHLTRERFDFSWSDARPAPTP